MTAIANLIVGALNVFVGGWILGAAMIGRIYQPRVWRHGYLMAAGALIIGAVCLAASFRSAP